MTNTCMYLGALIYVELAFHWYKWACSGWLGIFMADHSLFPKLTRLETKLKTEGITWLRSISWTSFLDGQISFKNICLSWESFPMGSLSKSISIRPIIIINFVKYRNKSISQFFFLLSGCAKIWHCLQIGGKKKSWNWFIPVSHEKFVKYRRNKSILRIF